MYQPPSMISHHQPSAYGNNYQNGFQSRTQMQPPMLYQRQNSYESPGGYNMMGQSNINQQPNVAYQRSGSSVQSSAPLQNPSNWNNGPPSVYTNTPYQPTNSQYVRPPPPSYNGNSGRGYVPPHQQQQHNISIQNKHIHSVSHQQDRPMLYNAIRGALNDSRQTLGQQSNQSETYPTLDNLSYTDNMSNAATTAPGRSWYSLPSASSEKQFCAPSQSQEFHNTRFSPPVFPQVSSELTSQQLPVNRPPSKPSETVASQQCNVPKTIIKQEKGLVQTPSACAANISNVASDVNSTNTYLSPFVSSFETQTIVESESCTTSSINPVDHIITSPAHSDKSSESDEKSREAALRDLKRMHRRDKLSGGSSDGTVFRKPKDKHRKRHHSSDKSKSPSSRVCPSPDSTQLPDISRYCDGTMLFRHESSSPSKSSEPEDRLSMSPRSDTTVAYCDGQQMDKLFNDENDKTSTDQYTPLLKQLFGQIDESIGKRRRLLGSGTECDSTNELFNEALKSNSQDRLTPSKQMLTSSGTGCVTMNNTNIRYCVLEEKRFYLWKDFKKYFTLVAGLEDKNFASMHLCSVADAKLLTMDYNKLLAVQEGDKLFNFKIEPLLFEENLEITRNYDNMLMDLTEDTLSVHNDDNSLFTDDGKDFMKKWLKSSTTTNQETVDQTNSANKLVDKSLSATDLKAELENLSKMSQDIIRSAFQNLMEECVQLREQKGSLQEQLETKTTHNKSLEDMLEKTANFMLM